MNKVYKIVTQKIIDKLNKGIIPWEKPWIGLRNYATKREYHGINLLLLSMEKHQSSEFVTFRQVREHKESVKNGSRASMVVFFRRYEVEARDKDGNPEIDKETGEPKKELRFALRYYNVFNLDQTTIPLPDYGNGKKSKECEDVLQNLKNFPAIEEGGSKAAYNPILDALSIPPKREFKDREKYYSSIFHELVHATGHETRLNRKDSKGNGFGSEKYSKEELVAEIGASFLCARCGIENKTIDNSAAYIQGWLKRLNNDSTLIISASAQAQKAVDYILNNNKGDF
ncbi:DNA primase TraC [subsurface metagenome]